MAGGHVSRTQRPNTWLHRPAMRRKDFPCQLGAVHTWRIAAVDRISAKGWKAAIRSNRRNVAKRHNQTFRRWLSLQKVRCASSYFNGSW